MTKTPGQELCFANKVQKVNPLAGFVHPSKVRKFVRHARIISRRASRCSRDACREIIRVPPRAASQALVGLGRVRVLHARSSWICAAPECRASPFLTCMHSSRAARPASLPGAWPCRTHYPSRASACRSFATNSECVRVITRTHRAYTADHQTPRGPQPVAWADQEARGFARFLTEVLVKASVACLNSTPRLRPPTGWSRAGLGPQAPGGAWRPPAGHTASKLAVHPVTSNVGRPLHAHRSS